MNHEDANLSASSNPPIAQARPSLEYQPPAAQKVERLRTPEESRGAGNVMFCISLILVMVGIWVRITLANRSFWVGDLLMVIGLSTLLLSRAFHREADGKSP